MMSNARDSQINQLKVEKFDLLIIGGGATGAGIAFDASLRGIKTALIEAEDFASGTSSKSTKLLHGGIRYLEQGIKNFDFRQLAVVKEALEERAIVMNLAPHLTKILPMMIPCNSYFQLLYYYFGVKLYEWIAKKSNLKKSCYLSAKEVLRKFPNIKKGVKGGILYYDGQFNDVRLNISLIHAAHDRGAVVANYVQIVDFIKKSDLITGVRGIDAISNQELTIAAKIVVNATGPFSDKIRKIDDPRANSLIQASAGTHIVVDKKYCHGKTGLVVPKTEDGRVLFILPWEENTLIGTTDIPTKTLEHPLPTSEEICFLIEQVNHYLDEKINPAEILASWTGVRPLIAENDIQPTKSIPRGFKIEISQSNLYSIIGGKWTLYRKMAQDVIDRAIQHGHLTQKSACQTKKWTFDIQRNLKSSLEKEIENHLLESYGDKAIQVIQIAEEGYSARLSKSYPYIEAEVIYAILHEFALTVDDVLYRRVPLGLHDQKAANKVLKRVNELIFRARTYKNKLIL